MNLNDLLQEAKDEGLDVTSAQEDAGSGFAPTAGETYRVEVVKARSSTTKNGVPQVGVHFKVLDGPDGVGRRFWYNLYFSDKMTDDHKKRNALVLGDVLNVVLTNVGFDGEELPFAPNTVVELVAKYGKDDFPNHSVLPVEDEGYTTSDDDDDDIDF